MSDSKLRKIINIIIQEEQKPVVTTKSDNIQIIMEKCYREAQDIINNKEKVNNKEAPKIIPMTPYEPKYGWKPIWKVLNFEVPHSKLECGTSKLSTFNN